MSNDTIEILGQKLSYPTTWYGTVSVFAVCLTIAAIFFMAKGWATPENMNELKGIINYSENQKDVADTLVRSVDDINNKITDLESKLIKLSSNNDPLLKKEIEVGQVLREIDISKLKEQNARQNYTWSENVAPLVFPAQDFSQKIELFKQEQIKQQQIQQDLSSRLRELQKQN